MYVYSEVKSTVYGTEKAIMAGLLEFRDFAFLQNRPKIMQDRTINRILRNQSVEKNMIVHDKI